jgi:hypothetical protein
MHSTLNGKSPNLPDFKRVVDRMTAHQQDSFGIRSSIHSKSKGREWEYRGSPGRDG